MSEESRNPYYQVLNTLYPGYSEFSNRRKDLIKSRTWQITEYASEVMKLLPRMKNPEDPLYQEGASIKDICNIAAIYAGICKRSKQPVAYFTGEYTNKGYDSYGLPVGDPVYRYERRTETEILREIEFEVEKYNSRPQISIRRFLESNCIQKYKIDYNTAVKVNEILNGIDNPHKERGDTKDNKEGMEK